MTIPATDGLTTLLRPQATTLLTAEPQASSALQADAEAKAMTADGSVDRERDTYQKAPRGLVRKLAEGRFNPVADLRHRIKHHAEIEARGLELPDLAEPKGNGRAYGKFLERYESLLGPDEDSDDGVNRSEVDDLPQRTPAAPITPSAEQLDVIV